MTTDGADLRQDFKTRAGWKPALRQNSNNRACRKHDDDADDNNGD